MNKLAMILVLVCILALSGCATTSTRVIAEDGASLNTRRIAVGGAKINGSEQRAEYSYKDGEWRMLSGDTTEETSADTDLLELILLGLGVKYGN